MSDSPHDRGLVSVEELTKQALQQRYWRCLEELARTSEFEEALHTEFPEQPMEWPEGASRRRFLSLMAGSVALAGLTGCTRQPTEMIMPYVDPPESAIPGRPKYYATAVPVNGIAQGVIVESHLGRPTKVEGNPAHPASLGATDVISQACLMDLYDPDRSTTPIHLGNPTTWDTFAIALNSALAPLRTASGAGLRILTETITSPSLGDQIQALLKVFPGAQWHQYDPAGAHSARAAAQVSFGRPVNTYYRLDTADVVVSLDSDFLACGPGSTRYARDFAARRRRGDRINMNRMYSIESSMTSTGGKADHRLPLRYADVQVFARELAAAVGAGAAQSSGSSAHADWISAVAHDLQAHAGACVVIPGDHQSAEVHSLAHAINGALGNAGKTVVYTDPIEVQPVDQISSLRALVQDIDSGRVEVLLILGGNPVFNAPADFEFGNRLAKIKTTVHAGLHFDETSLKCAWHIPETHFLEDWGDTRAFDGTVTVQQPLIAPLYDDSVSHARLLDFIVQFPGRSTYEIVRAYWAKQSGAGDFETWWRKTVHDGLVAGSGLPALAAVPHGSTMPTSARQAPEGLEIVFRPDVYVYDGRYGNNVWLQELPHPMTKLTWDNAIHISPVTAQRLKFTNQQHLQIRYRGRSVEGSIWIQPGHPEETVTVHLGYGHSAAGRAWQGAGFNAYAIRPSDAMWSGSGVELRPTGETYPLATTQMHQFMEDRELVISDTVDHYRQNPDFVSKRSKEPPKSLTLYPQWNYTGYAWGMSIDLTACVNCNACVIACQAENNIAVVGKQQVLQRRAMHWLRIDTYYKGDLRNPAAYYQPVPCMQCENAPCELVCPVQATNHSSDGLNDMIYNRCVGTRYCSNNCPYKVRRFNFLLFQDWTTETWKLQRNPDVTVRSRGVMEKCTYCVQRIREAEIHARTEDRFIRDGEIQTACQQACPTQAITFGDINNQSNRVAKLKTEKLNYALLAELNTRPRTTYLAELRNPNLELKETRA